jgi:hypothetical protein
MGVCIFCAKKTAQLISFASFCRNSWELQYTITQFGRLSSLVVSRGSSKQYLHAANFA